MLPYQLVANTYSHNYKIHNNKETKLGTFGEIIEDDIVTNFFSSGSEYHSTILDKNGFTLEFSLLDSLNNTNYRAIKRDDDIIVMGKKNGKDLDIKLGLNRGDWRQSISYTLSKFSQMKQDEIIFSILRIDKFETIEMKASKKGTSTVDVLGNQTQVEHIRITGNSFLSKMWYADYWFRSSDGLLIRCEAITDPIGFNKTIIELIE